MKPGIYTDVAELDYHAEEGLSVSGAKRILDCPARYRWERDNPPRKDVYDFGHAAHARVLGVGLDIVTCPTDLLASNGAASTKAAKEWIAQARADGKIVMKAEELAVIDAMAAKVEAHPDAVALLADGDPETSFAWRDEETGILLRGRADWITTYGGLPVVVDYKGLALDSPIPTPTGWTTMRDLAAGDRVLDRFGNPCTVTAKSVIHYNPTYRVTFDDKSQIICDADHRWLTCAGESTRLSWGVRTTDEIASTLTRRGQKHHRIPVARPLELPAADLAVDPYVLGCWLGDGTVGQGRITKPDLELFDLIKERGYSYSRPSSKDDSKCPTRTIYGLVTQLRDLGVLHEKRVPLPYLRASIEQRTDLLRGLMDTDGSWNDSRKQAVFTSTDEALARQVYELVVSLGQRANLSAVASRGYGTTVTAHRVAFRPTGINPFALGRKADRVVSTPTGESWRRVITSVEPIPTIPTQCIEVDSADRTYLCGESMIPTHNTTTDANPDSFRWEAGKHGYHMQDAWYREGLDHLTGERHGFVFIAQEKTAPYLVSVVELDDDARDVGAQRNQVARRLYHHCTTTGTWPAWPGIHRVSVPNARPAKEFTNV